MNATNDLEAKVEEKQNEKKAGGIVKKVVAGALGFIGLVSAGTYLSYDYVVIHPMHQQFDSDYTWAVKKNPSLSFYNNQINYLENRQDALEILQSQVKILTGHPHFNEEYFLQKRLVDNAWTLRAKATMQLLDYLENKEQEQSYSETYDVASEETAKKMNQYDPNTIKTPEARNKINEYLAERQAINTQIQMYKALAANAEKDPKIQEIKAEHDKWASIDFIGKVSEYLSKK